MATQITNYQCPACTGPMQFSAETGNLECEYCGSSFSVKEIEAMYAEKEKQAAENMAEAQAKEAENAEKESQWDTSGLSDNWGEDAAHMRSYSCPSCGAELICDDTTAATSCPYCGNPTVIPGQFTGKLRPDLLIPFRLTKDQAIQCLKKHYSGKLFLPGTFKAQNTIEKIQGIYVPFWLYDGTASGDFVYHTTKVHTYSRGDKRITETNHFNVVRKGAIAFEKVPVDASSKMPDDHMDSIEPFDYKDLTRFSTAYLPGFLADKYDVTIADSNKRADTRFAGTLEAEMDQTVTGYSSRTTVTKNIRLKRGMVHYAMLPVWLLNVKWNNQDFLFAINGQTGKTAGNLPVCKKKMFGFFAAVAAPLSALAVLLANLIVG